MSALDREACAACRESGEKAIAGGPSDDMDAGKFSLEDIFQISDRRGITCSEPLKISRAKTGSLPGMSAIGAWPEAMS